MLKNTEYDNYYFLDDLIIKLNKLNLEEKLSSIKIKETLNKNNKIYICVIFNINNKNFEFKLENEVKMFYYVKPSKNEIRIRSNHIYIVGEYDFENNTFLYIKENAELIIKEFEKKFNYVNNILLKSENKKIQKNGYFLTENQLLFINGNITINYLDANSAIDILSDYPLYKNSLGFYLINDKHSLEYFKYCLIKVNDVFFNKYILGTYPGFINPKLIDNDFVKFLKDNEIIDDALDVMYCYLSNI